MPGIGEVQLLVRFLQDADDVRPSFDRRDERRDVASAERIGEALKIVERQSLVGQCDDKVIEQRFANAGDFFGIVRPRKINAGDIGAGRSAVRRDRHVSCVNRCGHGCPPISARMKRTRPQGGAIAASCPDYSA